MKCIAIDYDACFADAPQTWRQVLELLHTYGYEVICATNREYTIEDRNELRAALPAYVVVVFCGKNYKEPMCRARGFEPTVWIDDTPSCIQRPKPLWASLAESMWHTLKSWYAELKQM